MNVLYKMKHVNKCSFPAKTGLQCCFYTIICQTVCKLKSLFNLPHSVLVSGSHRAEVYWTSRFAGAGQQLCITLRSISINPIDCAEEWNCSCRSEITSPFDGSVPTPNQSLQDCYNTQGHFCVDFWVSHSQNKGWNIKNMLKQLTAQLLTIFKH